MAAVIKGLFGDSKPAAAPAPQAGDSGRFSIDGQNNRTSRSFTDICTSQTSPTSLKPLIHHQPLSLLFLPRLATLD